MTKDNYGQYTDEELIQRLRNGETEISEYLLEKYKGIARKKARAMYLIGGETDDLILYIPQRRIYRRQYLRPAGYQQSGIYHH